MEIVPARRFQQRKPAENRIIAVINRFNLDNGNRGLIAGIITCPFAKGPFGLNIFQANFTFDRNFSIGGERQSCEWTLNYTQGLSKDSSRIIVFVDAVRHIGGRDDKIDRMMAEGNGNRKGLSLLMIFLSVDPPMFARRHVQSDAIRPMNHAAIGPDIHPTLLRIAADYQVVGADVASTVQFMPAWHREPEQIDLFPFQHVLKNRAIGNHFGFDRDDFLDPPAPALDEL